MTLHIKDAKRTFKQGVSMLTFGAFSEFRVFIWVLLSKLRKPRRCQVRWINILVTCWKSLTECTRPRKNNLGNIWRCPGAGARTGTPTETATETATGHTPSVISRHVSRVTWQTRVFTWCRMWAVCQHQELSAWELLWRRKVRRE